MAIKSRTNEMPADTRPNDQLRTPLYHQVYLILRDKIVSGVFTDGALIPSEAELSRMYGVSRITVRRAVEDLASEGLVRRRRGAGTNVTYEPGRDVISVDVKNILSGLFEIGKETTVRLLEYGVDLPPADVKRALRLGDGEKVQRTVRVRSTLGNPFSFIVAYVPYEIAVKFDRARLETDSLVDLLESTGRKLTHASQNISAGLADPIIARTLGVDVGSALITANRVMYDENNQPVEFVRARYRPDRFQYWLDMERAPANADGKAPFVVSNAGRAAPTPVAAAD
ncbi:MAG: GntR family transcriptional regulator [Rhodospirillales bacterium]